MLLMGFKLMAGAVASCALIGVAVGVGIIYGSLLISIGRNLIASMLCDTFIDKFMFRRATQLYYNENP